MLHLRPYQKEALESVKKSFKNNIHKQLLVLPTGAGKTVLFIAITQHFKRKTLILAHRDELITQAYEKFKKFYPEVDISIYKGNNHDLDHQVIISSVQTCNRRISQLKKKGFKLLIVDESHHATSNTYQNIISELDFLDDPKKLLIGVTATPNRADKQSLADIFQKITYSISIDKLIKDKYLSPVIGRRILTDFKLSGIKTSMGDFAVGELAYAVNIPERNTFIVNKWKQHALHRKTIVFCVNVQHCKDVAEEFNKQGIITRAVWGDMNPIERKETLEDFSKEIITIITSCGILTEGFDEPSVSCIVMARPTKSSGLYTQCIGRGLRIDDSINATKQDCLVLDFTDKHHNLNTIISLQAIMPQTPVILDESAIAKTAPNLSSKKPTIKSDVSIDREFNILAMPKFIWLSVGDEYSLSSDYGSEIIICKKNDFFVAYLFDENAESQLLVEKQPTLKACKDLCEEFAQSHLMMNYADMNSLWYIQNSCVKASFNQIKFLQQNNAYKNSLSKASASTQIRKIIAISKWKKRKTNNSSGNHIKNPIYSLEHREHLNQIHSQF